MADLDIQSTGDVPESNNPSEGTPESTEPAVQKYKIQYGRNSDGSPFESEYTIEELQKYAGIGLSSSAKAEEIKRKEAEVLKAAANLKDPEKVWEVLKVLGHDVDGIINKRFDEIIRDHNEDPTSKELRLTKAKLEKYLKMEEEQKAEKARVQYQKDMEELSAYIKTALKGANMAETEANAEAVLHEMIRLFNYTDEAGVRPFGDASKIPMDKLIAEMKKARLTGFKELIDSTEDDDAFLELIPEEIQKRFQKAYTKKLSKETGIDNTVKPKPVKEEKPAESSRKEHERKIKTSAQVDREIKDEIARAQAAWLRAQGK